MTPRKPPRSRAQTRLWLILAIAAFLVVDAALVAWALSSTHKPHSLQAGPVPTFTSEPNATATPTPTPTAPTAQAAPRILTAVSATEAYRATPGACTGGDAVVEKTTDGGANWQTLGTTRYGMHRILSLSDASDTRLSAVSAAGDNCAVSFYSSFTGGQFWQEYPGNLAGAAYVDPPDPANIHTAAGVQPAPCAGPLQLAVSGNSTAVLCAGTVAAQSAGGAWTKLSVPGVLAIAASDSGYTLAVSGASGCAGVAIETLPPALTASTKPQQVGCAAAVTAPAQLTLSQQGSNLWMWTADTVSISTDAGATWS